MPRLRWIGGLSAEAGGPCILADTSAFPAWTADKPLPGSTALTLHHWGQFTAELPAKFRPNGKVGHQYLHFDTHEAAMGGLEALRTIIRKKWPSAHEALVGNDGSVTGSISLADGRVMRVDLIKPNHYEILCGLGPETTVYAVSAAARFLAWDQEGGAHVQVGQTSARDEIVLMRSWVDDEETESRVRGRIETKRDEKKHGTYDFETSAAALLWSPFAFTDLKLSVAELASLAKSQQSFGIHECGFAFTVKPGSYAVTSAYEEGDGWMATWCRLTLK